VPLHRCGARLINGGDVVPRSRRDGMDLAGRRRGRIGVGALNPARARARLSLFRVRFFQLSRFITAVPFVGVACLDRPTDLLIWSSSSTRIRVRLQFFSRRQTQLGCYGVLEFALGGYENCFDVCR
jgi:hypothetical protein